METIFLVDNRQLRSESFDEESSEATYRQLSSTLLSHYIRHSLAHSWIPTPSAYVFAASPSTARLVVDSPRIRTELQDLLSPRFSASGNPWVR